MRALSFLYGINPDHSLTIRDAAAAERSLPYPLCEIWYARKDSHFVCPALIFADTIQFAAAVPGSRRLCESVHGLHTRQVVFSFSDLFKGFTLVCRYLVIRRSGARPLALFALLLLLPPLVLTFMKFVELVTLGERDHQFWARFTKDNLRKVSRLCACRFVAQR